MSTETKQGYLIDMDGVIYRSSETLPGSVEFITGLRERGIPFLFVTNNSQRTRRDIAMKLARMETDILGGVQMGYRSILVLSGGTRREDLKNFAFRPDIVVSSVADLCTDTFFATGRLHSDSVEADERSRKAG